MRSSIITLIALALLLAGSSAVRAAELTATDAQVSTKKITLSFSLSDLTGFEKVADYTANILRIKVEGLEMSSAQLKGDKLIVKDEHGVSFYRFTRFSKIDGGSMISIYLGKLCSPADALVVPRDGRIEVEIIKPLWKLDGPATAGSTPAADDTATEDTPVEDQPVNDDGSGDNPPPANDVPPTTPASDTGTQPVSNTNGNGTLNNGNASQDLPVRPAFDSNGTQSYRKFDLNAVPAAKVELKGVPFDEAILRIVADSGFNVVVGTGIDDTEVNLNFTQKGISLESALDILCMAYELKYDVTDDAIVISRR